MSHFFTLKCPIHTYVFLSARGLMHNSNFMSRQWTLTIWSVHDCFEMFKTIGDKRQWKAFVNQVSQEWRIPILQLQGVLFHHHFSLGWSRLQVPVGWCRAEWLIVRCSDFQPVWADRSDWEWYYWFSTSRPTSPRWQADAILHPWWRCICNEDLVDEALFPMEHVGWAEDLQLQAVTRLAHYRECIRHPCKPVCFCTSFKIGHTQLP